MMGRLGSARHLFDRDHAAIENLAVFVFELDRRVADVEVVFENVMEVVQDPGALRRWDVGDGDVAGQRPGLRTETPDVQVVHIQNAGDCLHIGADLVQVDAPGGAFEKNVEGFPNDAHRRPQDERGDDDGEHGVDPVVAGNQDAGASGDYGGGGEGVAGHVDEGGAQVHVAGDSPEHGGDYAVHQHPGRGHVHHQARLHRDRRVEAMDGFNADPQGDQDEGAGIDKGGQHSGALIAESA